MTIVLITNPTNEFVERFDLPFPYSPAPGVVHWGVRTFMYAYQENPTTFVYRETFAIMLP